MTLTRNRHTKSRFGCAECKSRRIKCDEATPACGQCVSRSLDCPGHTTEWKWSMKHERCRPQTLQLLPKHRKSQKRIDKARQEETTKRDSSNNLAQQSASLVVDAYGHQKLGLDLQTPSIRVQTTSTLSKVDLLGSVEGVLCDVKLQVDYFSEVICKALFVFDSYHNHFRSASLSRIQVSILFFSLCRYITAAFLGSKFDREENNGLTVQNAQNDLLHRLIKAVTGAEVMKMKQLEDILLAIIMYGLSVNWDGSNAPGFMHYNAAVALFHHAASDQTFQRQKPDRLNFFAQSLIYWRMGLGFVTDVSENPLSDSHIVRSTCEFYLSSTGHQKSIPHPLTGVSPFSQFLLGEIGSLIYNQRKRSKCQTVLRSNSLKQDFTSFTEAQRLEQQLLSLPKPQEQDFLDTGDPNTSLHDLINMAEAYRLSGLILLYRVFPDLLKRGPDLAADPEPTLVQQEDQHLWWMSELAIHILDLLEKNDSQSGTRNMEQIILIIVAGELRIPSFCGPELERGMMKGCCKPPWSRLGCDEPVILTEMRIQVSPQVQPHECESSILQEPSLVDVCWENIVKARSVLLNRLRWVRNVLRYKSIEKVEELILETWKINDDKENNSFWLDVMIDKDWRFLFV